MRAIVLLLLGLPVAAAAQDAPADRITELGRRPLGDLVEALPGRTASLDSLVRVALERNLALESARLRRLIGDAGVDVAGGDFDVGFDLGIGVARDRLATDRTSTYRAGLGRVLPWGTELGVDVSAIQAPTPGAPGSAYDAEVGLSFRQPLLEGFMMRDAPLRVARLVGEASVHRLGRALAEVAAGVELSYWDLAEAEAIEAVLQRSHEIAEALLLRNEALAERALVADVDVITARSGVALRRATLVDARRQRSDAAERVVFLVWGEGAEGELAGDRPPLKTLPTEPPTMEVLPLDVAQSLALQRRRDLAAARAELRGAELSAEEARNARRPFLALDGGWFTGGTETSLGGSIGALDQGSSWSLGLTFSQPLGNRRDAGLHQVADLTRRLRRLDLAVVENLVRQEVRAAVRAIVAGRERLEAAEEAAALAAAQLEAERRRLDLGLGDSFRLLETEENAVQAELEAVRARYDLARALTRYRLALGEPG